MKKSIFVLCCLFVLAFIPSSSAWINIGIIGGEICQAPSYYASAILSWDGDGASTLTAYDSSCNAVVFTDDSSDISTYGESGSNALKVDDQPESIYYTQTSNQYLSTSAAQTLCARVYVSAQLDANAPVLTGENAGSEEAMLGVDPNTPVRSIGYWDFASGSEVNCYGASVGFTTWRTIGYSWDISGIDHSTNPGDEATWADGWEDDLNELTAMSNGVTEIRAGNFHVSNWGDPATSGQYYYIDDWAIVSGYKANCEDIFGK